MYYFYIFTKILTMRYIDADILLEEIDELYRHVSSIRTKNITEENFKEARLIGYKDAIHKINSMLNKQTKNES